MHALRAIEWNETGRRFYETGIDRCVLYPDSDGSGLYWNHGVAWNGLIGVDETPSGGEVSSYYYDGVKYLDYVESEDFQATLEAYTYPDEFEQFDGNDEVVPGMLVTGQLRKPFSLSYRSFIGSDTVRAGKDYKLHLVYNVIAQPNTKSRKTISGTADATTFQWSITGVPPIAPYPTVAYKPTAHVVIDTRRLTADQIFNLELYLYGVIPDETVIDGGSPSYTTPDILDGGHPSGMTFGDPVDGGSPSTNTTFSPTLLAPPYIKSLLTI